jgi:hypothetical protein
MDVNEHDKLSNITLGQKYLVKELFLLLFYIAVTVGSSKNENKSYPKMRMKRPASSFQLKGILYLRQ